MALQPTAPAPHVWYRDHTLRGAAGAKTMSGDSRASFATLEATRAWLC